MSKFKKGDKVRVVKEWPKDESTVTFIDCMGRHLGEEFTIYGETPKGNYEVEENGLVWHEKWLEPIEKVSKFKKGDKVRVVSERPPSESTTIFFGCMERYLGRELKIYGKTKPGGYKVAENNLIWHEKWLEPIEKVVSKFKVGEKVRVVPHRPENERLNLFQDSMVKYLGKVLTIRCTDIDGDCWVVENSFCWHKNWLDHIESPHKVKTLENVKIGNSVYHEDGTEYYVHNVMPEDDFPICIIEIGGDISHQITIDGRFGGYLGTQFFREKPKVKKCYTRWFNLVRHVNSSVSMRGHDTKDSAESATYQHTSKVLNRAAELKIEYEE